jgi:hypothetical protein
MVDGVPGNVFFSGALATFHGSTERNSGDSVPVVITQGKVTSPPVTVSVR